MSRSCCMEPPGAGKAAQQAEALAITRRRFYGPPRGALFIGANGMTNALRHRCRQCRGKLPAPTDNERHGFASATTASIGVAAASVSVICARPARVTLIASIVGRQIGAAPKPGNGRESMNTGYGTYRAKRASEVPILRASKTATRGTVRPFIVSANGGGVATVNTITPYTTRMD